MEYASGGVIATIAAEQVKVNNNASTNTQLLRVNIIVSAGQFAYSLVGIGSIAFSLWSLIVRV